jgi:hypothetical protein
VLVGGAALIGLSIAGLAFAPVSQLFFTIRQTLQLPFWE